MKENSTISEYRLHKPGAKKKPENNDSPEQQIPVPPDQELPAPINEPEDPENPNTPIDEDIDKTKMIV